MLLTEDNRPQAEHLHFGELAGEDEIREGTRRDMQPGRAVYYDGTNKVTGVAPAFPDRSLVLTAWVKLLGGTNQVIFHIGLMRVIMLSDGRFRIYYEDGLNYETTGLIPFNQWGHLGVILTPNRCALVWNNVIVDDRAATVSGIVSTTSANGVGLGYRHDGVTEVSNFKGYMFDVRIHNSNSINAVSDSYNYKKTGATNWYKLDEGAGTVAYDSSGNGRNGAWTGLVSSSHYTGSDVPYSYQNQVGYGVQLYEAPVLSYNYASTRVEYLDGETRAYYVGGTSYTNIGIGNTSAKPELDGKSITVEYEIKADASIGAITGVTHLFSSNYSKALVVGQWVQVAYTIASKPGNQSSFLINNMNIGTGAPAHGSLMYTVRNLKFTVNNLFPGNEANPGHDVLGNLLTYTGKAPAKLAYKGSLAGYNNGTHQISFPAGALTGVTVTRCGGTAAPYVSGDLIQFSAIGSFWDLGLSNGWSFLLSEGGGNIAHNVAGTQHGTIVGDTGVFWSKRQDVFHHNLTKGATWDAANSRYIPAENATQDVTGNALTNPAGPWYNFPETAIDFSGGVASPYSLKVPTNWKGEPDTANMNSRRRGNKVDRICLDSAATTGTRLLRQQQYTKKI